MWYLKQKLKLNLLVLLEPLIQLDQFFMCTKYKVQKVIANCSNKIWVMFDEDYQVEVLVDHVQVLHCRVSSTLLPEPIYMSFVYAKCTKAERVDLWDQIRSFKVLNAPWSVGGDFNIITQSSERVGGAAPNVAVMNDFCNCILDCDLLDIGFEGVEFTWMWRDIKQRLDRILFNQCWLDILPGTKVSHGVRRLSDHRPLIITAEASIYHHVSSFRFQNMWLLHSNYIDSIAKHWELPARQTGILKFWEKLKRLKQHLYWWNKHIFGDVLRTSKSRRRK